MNLKTEIVFRKLDSKIAELEYEIYIDDQLFDSYVFLRGPIAEVKAYQSGEIKSLDEVKKIWDKMGRSSFSSSDDLAYIVGCNLKMLSNVPQYSAGSC